MRKAQAFLNLLCLTSNGYDVMMMMMIFVCHMTQIHVCVLHLNRHKSVDPHLQAMTMRSTL